MKAKLFLHPSMRPHMKDLPLCWGSTALVIHRENISLLLLLIHYLQEVERRGERQKEVCVTRLQRRGVDSTEITKEIKRPSQVQRKRAAMSAEALRVKNVQVRQSEWERLNKLQIWEFVVWHGIQDVRTECSASSKRSVLQRWQCCSTA